MGDIEDMSKNAISILKDEATLSQFKVNASEVAKTFDIQNILPLYEDLYFKALQNK
mgnify:FL=1